MSLYWILFRKLKTRVGILCWPLLEQVYCAHIHVSSLGVTCWKPVNTLFELKYLQLHCVVVGNLHNDDSDYQTASYNVGFIFGPRHYWFSDILVIKLLPWKKNVVNLKTFSCHMLNPPHNWWLFNLGRGAKGILCFQIWLFLVMVLARFINLFF